MYGSFRKLQIDDLPFKNLFLFLPPTHHGYLRHFLLTKISQEYWNKAKTKIQTISLVLQILSPQFSYDYIAI